MEGISGLLGFLIFNSNSSLIKCSEIRIMGQNHLSSKVGQWTLDYQIYLLIFRRTVSHLDFFSSPSCDIIRKRITRLLFYSFQISTSYIQLSVVFILLDKFLNQQQPVTLNLILKVKEPRSWSFFQRYEKESNNLWFFPFYLYFENKLQK